MGSHGFRIDTEQWHGDESPITTESQDGITQLQRSVMLTGILLAKVDVKMPLPHFICNYYRDVGFGLGRHCHRRVDLRDGRR